MSTKNARTLGIRLDETDAQRLAHFEATTQIEAVSLARAALKAALNTFDEHGTLTLPLYIVTQNPASKPEFLAAQQPSNVVTLPPPSVVATLLHDTVAETSHSPPITEPCYKRPRRIGED